MKQTLITAAGVIALAALFAVTTTFGNPYVQLTPASAPQADCRSAATG